MPVDTVDAELVERAVCSLKYPRDRKAMKWFFVTGLDSLTLSRRLRVSMDLVDAFKHRLLGALQYRIEQVQALQPRGLQSQKSASNVQTNNLTPPKGAYGSR
jgi:hypothetical protein